MSKHTPGPWHVVDCRRQVNGQIRIFGEIHWIANVLARCPDCEANAQLIISAPLGLELAEMVLAYDDPEGTEPLYVAIVAKARELLAVAKGEKKL